MPNSDSEDQLRLIIEDTQSSIGKDEMNLAEYPFALLAKRAAENQKTLTVVQEGRDENGKPIRQEWIVTGSDRFGLPVAADDEVYVALMKLLRDNRVASRTVQFRVSQLLRIMRSGTGKRDYQRVQQALDRLATVSIRSTNAFWDHSRKRYLTEAFHLLESYRLSGGGSGRELSEVTFSEFLFSSIKAGYVKNLDTEFYFSLSCPLARRYYRLLDKHRYRNRPYEIELHRLAERLPLQDEYPSHIKRRLDPIHEEFVQKNFLESVEYRTGTSGDTIVQFRFVLRQPSAPIEAAEPSLSEQSSDPLEAAKIRLTSVGVSRTVAAELIEQYPMDEIERQLTYLPFVQGLRNPGGYLRLAIQNGYGPPPGWTKSQEATTKSKLRGKLRDTSASVVPAADPDIEQKWNALTPEARESLFADAEQALRSSSALWKGSRRIPQPLLEAHARHLLREVNISSKRDSQNEII